MVTETRRVMEKAHYRADCSLFSCPASAGGGEAAGSFGSPWPWASTFCPGPTCLPSLNRAQAAACIKTEEMGLSFSPYVPDAERGFRGLKWGTLHSGGTSTDFKEDTVTSALSSDQLGTSPSIKF